MIAEVRRAGFHGHRDSQPASLDGLLAAPGLLAPIEESWAENAVGFGRPTVPMDRFVRLMLVEARSGWGYESLVPAGYGALSGGTVGSVRLPVGTRRVRSDT
jgi:hypothetical protein